MSKKITLICEIGCNHRGDLETAKKMIKVAAEYCNVDVIKFQKRTNKSLLSSEEYNKPHPVPENSYGSTYGEHREKLEFTLEQHNALKGECEKFNVIYSTSVWDLNAASEMIQLKPKLLKIPSATNTDKNLLEFLFKNYKGEIHISLGMTKKDEEAKIFQLAKKYEREKDTIFYHCISSYPVETDNLFLNEITNLKKMYDEKLKGIGFSGHHKGIAPDIAALTLGAKYFERHFTLDRTWKGTDHAASLEPDGMRRLSRDLNLVAKSLKEKPEEILEIEQIQREKLKRIIDF